MFQCYLRLVRISGLCFLASNCLVFLSAAAANWQKPRNLKRTAQELEEGSFSSTFHSISSENENQSIDYSVSIRGSSLAIGLSSSSSSSSAEASSAEMPTTILDRHEKAISCLWDEFPGIRASYYGGSGADSAAAPKFIFHVEKRQGDRLVSAFENLAVEFGHSWPDEKWTGRLSLTDFISWFCTRTLMLMTEGRLTRDVNIVLSRGLIDLSRPVVIIQEGKQHFTTVLHLILQSSTFSSQMFHLVLQYFPRECLNRVDSNGQSALDTAIRRNCADAVRMLLAAGANPNVFNGGRLGGNALCLATFYGNREIISELAKCGRADPYLAKGSISVATFMYRLKRPEAIVFYVRKPGRDAKLLHELLLRFYRKDRQFALGCLAYAIHFPLPGLFGPLLNNFIADFDDFEAACVILRSVDNFKLIVADASRRYALLHAAVKSGKFAVFNHVINLLKYHNPHNDDNVASFQHAINLSNNAVVDALAPSLSPETLHIGLISAVQSANHSIVSTLVKHIPSLNDVTVNGISLPCFVALNGSCADLKALLRHDNFDPLTMDGSGRTLAGIEGCAPAMAAFIKDFVQRFSGTTSVLSESQSRIQQRSESNQEKWKSTVDH